LIPFIVGDGKIIINLTTGQKRKKGLKEKVYHVRIPCSFKCFRERGGEECGLKKWTILIGLEQKAK
jgi:hypothetical protein